MLAFRGTIQGNTVIVEEEDIKYFEGEVVILSILDYPFGGRVEGLVEKKIDLSKYMGRGEKMFQSDAQEYIKEMRDNDRI